MLTLYHAPYTRSSSIIQLLIELNALDRVDVRVVDVARQDGRGTADPANLHPEGKVPLLVHDGVMIRERGAIIQYLTELFPSELAPKPGDPTRGAYLGWLAYYGAVIEPVMITTLLGLDHPGLHANFRGKAEMSDALINALSDQPYLLGDRFTAVDLLVSSPFDWMPSFAPTDQVVQDWLARCTDRPAYRAMGSYDAGLMPAAKAG
ncbi:glutathione S-transferase N-terminal domain-containing protein [Loktanella sp. TSTF-M6]|uniref:Glutathione S-transferase N-terminal domain-containing protein n=1 Tax=Loktanella gaetbuli TaxID=2881335 RepID=A0ABS8BUL5_9RHOB|nr:glutathione S-transferase N-terminal domain-containing protein [Loktanella gaetbuli]MCB5199406.1 glutathione S-transferase N-terminal domain-containing protein [Loktanella gaetbuli]